jgi:hypothetical protein
VARWCRCGLSVAGPFVRRCLTSHTMLPYIPLRSLTLRLHARQVAFATLCTRGFSSLVASPAALIATGWSEPVPGRVYPRCGPAPSRRTRFGVNQMG